MDWIAPATPEELADAVRAHAGEGDVPPVTGAADPPADLPSGARPPDAVLSTAGLSGVREHRPRDLTVTAGAGTRMDDLLGRLSEAGGWLPFGGPARELSVGGAVACALPGPFDAGHGDLRRQLLACELVTWTGRRTRWGRGVMKNVAGYGMTRAVAGSFGRLGVIARATFRLWPAPEVRRRARLRPAGAGDALDAAGRIALSRFDADVRPDAVVWRGAPGAEAGGGSLEVRLTGTADSVELRLGRLRSWAADAGLGVDADPGRDPPGIVGRRRADAASAAWVTAGRRDFERAARSAREALADDLLALGGYPLSGDLRCAWAGPAHPRLLDALDGLPVRIERGRRAEIDAAESRRDGGLRRLERRVLEAVGGRPRGWLSGFL